jgi:hypothetical protein
VLASIPRRDRVDVVVALVMGLSPVFRVRPGAELALLVPAVIHLFQCRNAVTIAVPGIDVNKFVTGL